MEYRLTGKAVCFQYIRQAWLIFHRHGIQGRLHTAVDVVEADVTPEELHHRLLVGAVHNGGGGAAHGGALPGDFQAAEGVLIRPVKRQAAALQQIQRRLRRGGAVGIGEGVADGQLHIRRAQLSDHGSVHVLHQGVNDALAVNHRVHLGKGQAVEPHGLDDLQALIHQGGAVDGDFGTHGPVGVLQGILGPHGLQLLIGFAEEGPAAAGEDEAAKLRFALAAPEALEDGGMLAVHGDDLRAAAVRLVHHQLAGAHQRLLVGQGDGFMGLDGVDGGRQSGKAYHGGQYHINGDGFHYFIERLLAGIDLHVGHVAHQSLQLVVTLFVGNDDGGRLELMGLLSQQFYLVIGCQAINLIEVAVFSDNLQGLCAYRPRRAEDSYLFLPIFHFSLFTIHYSLA